MCKWGETWELPCSECGGRGRVQIGDPIVDPWANEPCTCTGGVIRIPVEPAAGLLVASCEDVHPHRYMWWILGDAIQSQNNGLIHYCTSVSGPVVYRDKPNVDVTPLLPAPAALLSRGLNYPRRAAMDILAGKVSLTCDTVTIHLEYGCIEYYGGNQLRYYPSSPYVAPGQVPALQRDLQKYTTLLAYLRGFEEVHNEQ